jgi:PAS domain S-box-containing protein
MSWVTVIWSMAAAACLTLAAIHLLVWSRRHSAWANLLFSLASVATAAYAACELWMMRSRTPAEYALALRWVHVPVWVLIVSLVAFAHVYLRAERLWLACAVFGVRTLALLLNFGPAANLNYREVTALRPVRFLGEAVSVAEGVANPWMLVGQLSLLLFVVFVVDTALAAWRRGDRGQALVVGGSLVFFATGGVVDSVLILWGIVHAPLTATPLYLCLVAAMGYELSHDVLRAARLSDDLREREQQMAVAADAANLGLWVWTMPQDTVWGTEKLNPMLGFAPGVPLSAEAFLTHLHPEDREPTRQALRRALDEGSDYASEYRVMLPDGRERWIAARGRVEKAASDGSARMLGVCLDVTERKLTEEQFRLVVEASPSGVMLVDREGRVVLVNRKTERQFGYTRDELTGKPVELLMPERLRGDHSGYRSGFLAAPRARGMGIGKELFARRKDGTEFACEIGLSPVERGGESLVLVAIVDVTARKQAEGEMLRLRDELTHAGRVSTMAQLASGLAHELSQPLAAILRNAEAAQLLLQSSAPDLEEVRAILTDICKDDDRAGGVIDHMRALLKRRGLERVELDLAELVSEVLVLVQPDAASRKVRLAVEVPGTLPRVRGDRVHLQQVLLNLILNGMDAMTEVPPEDRRLVVRARQTDARAVEVAVADYGRGVPAAKLERLFEPFVTTKRDGMGLGLPISASIIEAHGGRIWAESGPAGATFYFTVPLGGEA